MNNLIQSGSVNCRGKAFRRINDGQNSEEYYRNALPSPFMQQTDQLYIVKS